MRRTSPTSLPRPRAEPMLSNSSKRYTPRVRLKASKISRSLAAVSPMNLVISASRRTTNKGRPSSPANAEAVSVFPVPGLPMSRTFRRGASPRLRMTRTALCSRMTRSSFFRMLSPSTMSASAYSDTKLSVAPPPRREDGPEESHLSKGAASGTWPCRSMPGVLPRTCRVRCGPRAPLSALRWNRTASRLLRRARQSML